MLKRILMVLAMGAALVACSPSGSSTSSSTETLAPVESTAPSVAAPSTESSMAPSESASASP